MPESIRILSMRGRSILKSMKTLWGVCALLSTLVVATAVTAAPPDGELPAALRNLSVGGVLYLSYQNGQAYNGANLAAYNAFQLKRGYLDARKGFDNGFSVRYTTDITRSGGSWNTRIKYLYGDFSLGSFWQFTQASVEFGQVHVPWIDFEESINGFRMQGTMFLERFGILNSADDGATFSANLSGEMDQMYQSEVSGHYAGRLGSVQLGVYNGGGYHATENNLNKVLEGRVTIRPVPSTLPGLQVTVFGIMGKTNLAAIPGSEVPKWNALDAMLSYQRQDLTATVQYYTGKGNQSGSAIHPTTRTARAQSGFSVFGAYHLGKAGQYTLITRLDIFDSDTDTGLNDQLQLFIGGFAWQMNSSATWLVDYQQLNHD